MSESDNGNTNERDNLLNQIRQWRVDADKGREPELLSSRLGTRHFSQAALIERVVDAFIDEHSGGTEALRDADTESKRLKLLLGTVDYVLGIESIQMPDKDKAALIRRVYNELFTYGPLDALFEDETITTITLEGADKVAVRHGHGELESLDPIFENGAHLMKIIRRLLIDSGAELTPTEPIIETGLRVNGRPVSLNIAGPPVSIQISADIRVHPRTPPALDDMTARGVMPGEAAEALRALARSPHGIIIVGEPESGKTTLLGALAQAMTDEQHSTLTAVERTGELQLPEGASRLVVEWLAQDEDSEPKSFGQQIAAALESEETTCILLDEVRADEAQAIGRLLSEESVPRLIWAFRGPASSKRLVSAVGMLARRSGTDPSASEHLVRALYERLPFVVTLRRREGRLQLHSISEWQVVADSDYPDFVELMAMDWEGLAFTGQTPARPLQLPHGFWTG